MPIVSARYLQDPYYAPGCMNPCFKIVAQSHGGYALGGKLIVFMPSSSTKTIPFKIDYTSAIAEEYNDTSTEDCTRNSSKYSPISGFYAS